MPIHTYIDAQTGESTQVEMTGAELKEYEKNTAAALANLAAFKELEQKKSELYSKLGITEDEAKLLLS